MPFFDETVPGTGLPTIAAGTGAGTGATVTLVQPGSTDKSGVISVVTTTNVPSISAVIATLTFHSPLPAPANVTITPGNAAAGVLASALPYAVGTKTAFTLNAEATGLAISSTYLFNYHVV